MILESPVNDSVLRFTYNVLGTGRFPWAPMVTCHQLIHLPFSLISYKKTMNDLFNHVHKYVTDL